MMPRGNRRVYPRCRGIKDNYAMQAFVPIVGINPALERHHFHSAFPIVLKPLAILCKGLTNIRALRILLVLDVNPSFGRISSKETPLCVAHFADIPSRLCWRQKTEMLHLKYPRWQLAIRWRSECYGRPRRAHAAL